MIRFPALNRVVRIAFVGAGRIGGSLARLWPQWGHDLHIGFRLTRTSWWPGLRSSGTMSALHVGGGHA